MRYIHLSGLLLLFVLLQACSQQSTSEKEKSKPAAVDYMKIYTVQGSYEDVRQDLEDAITGKGIVTSGISHISDMLQRTGRDLGLDGKIYAHAEAINFCSATISRNMMQVDPTNIVFCPYIIAIYSLPEKPGVVYLAYRRPPPLPTKESTEALAAVENLLQSIIEDVAM